MGTVRPLSQQLAPVASPSGAPARSPSAQVGIGRFCSTWFKASTRRLAFGSWSDGRHPYRESHALFQFGPADQESAWCLTTA